MKKKLFLIIIVIAIAITTKAQTISRQVFSSSGGTLTGGNNSINYNIGEPVIASLNAGGYITSHGFEQPGESGLTLKLFLQGYYVNAGTMQPVLINQGLAALLTETDTILVELHNANTFELVDSRKSVLRTDGTVSVNFTQPEGKYYVAIKHRNSIQTWSANPVDCTVSTQIYDFSTAANQAMGDNQVEVEPGVFAFFTGDLNQDDFIDGNDFPVYDTDSFNGIAQEYAATDLNGDGFVDGNDFPVYDLNSLNGVTGIHP